MSFKMAAIAMAIATAGTIAGVPAWSQTTSSTATNPEVKLASQYGSLAGSPKNADSLITGLRDGKNVLLITSLSSPNPTAPSVTFTPTTHKLSYGEINIALSLAKADLAKQGITDPTPAQLAAALNGGTITIANGQIVTMTGILAQRQSGSGWGQIANAMGVKLGTLVSASKTAKAGKKDDHDSQADESSGSRSPGKSEQAHANLSGSKGGNSGGAGNGGSSSGGGGGRSSNSGGGHGK